MSIDRDGWLHAAPALLLALLAGILGHLLAAGLLVLLSGALLLFFRVPRAHSGAPPDTVLAAAHGRVLRVEPAAFPEGASTACQRIITFLSVFDVHVQRAPMAGRLESTRHTPGRKVAAFRDDAGRVNEHQTSVLVDAAGRRFAMIQIAGLIARRVVFRRTPGQDVERGELVGLIRFGSRVDVLVPVDYEILVRPGDRTRAGITPLARPPLGDLRPREPRPEPSGDRLA